MNILLACERSGGHIFPALVFGKKLRARYGDGATIRFFITSDFLKDYLVKDNFSVIGKSFKGRFLLFELIYRFFESIAILIKFRPEKVFGFGGRDSFFLVLLAHLFRAHTYIYEPNVEFGKANKILSKVAHKTFTGFEQKSLGLEKVEIVGVPLRDNIRRLERNEALNILGLGEGPVLLCFGGSQGSVFLNDNFLRLVETLPENYQIVHFTGPRDYLEILQRYNKIKNRRFIKDFYPAMEVALSAADFVFCRSGASTVAEVAYFKVPAIFVPHPAAGGHQKTNALYLSGKGAAVTFYQSDFSFDTFRTTVLKILSDKSFSNKIKNNLISINPGVEFEKFCHGIDL